MPHENEVSTTTALHTWSGHKHHSPPAWTQIQLKDTDGKPTRNMRLDGLDCAWRLDSSVDRMQLEGPRSGSLLDQHIKVCPSGRTIVLGVPATEELHQAFVWSDSLSGAQGSLSFPGIRTWGVVLKVRPLLLV